MLLLLTAEELKGCRPARATASVRVWRESCAAPSPAAAQRQQGKEKRQRKKGPDTEPFCLTSSALGRRSLLVDAFSNRDRVELRVGSLFLVQVCRQKPNYILMSELLGPRD